MNPEPLPPRRNDLKNWPLEGTGESHTRIECEDEPINTLLTDHHLNMEAAHFDWAEKQQVQIKRLGTQICLVNQVSVDSE